MLDNGNTIDCSNIVDDCGDWQDNANSAIAIINMKTKWPMFRIVFLVISSALLHISFLRAFICVFAIAFVSYPCFDYLVVTPNVTILLNAHRSNLECDDDYSQAIYQYLVRMIADVFGLLSMLQFVFFHLVAFSLYFICC